MPPKMRYTSVVYSSPSGEVLSVMGREGHLSLHDSLQVLRDLQGSANPVVGSRVRFDVLLMEHGANETTRLGGFAVWVLGETGWVPSSKAGS